MAFQADSQGCASACALRACTAFLWRPTLLWEQGGEPQYFAIRGARSSGFGPPVEMPRVRAGGSSTAVGKTLRFHRKAG